MEVIGSVTNTRTLLILLKTCCLGVIPGLQAKSCRRSCVCTNDEPFSMDCCYTRLYLTNVSSGFPVIYSWPQGEAAVLENEDCFIGFQKWYFCSITLSICFTGIMLSICSMTLSICFPFHEGKWM